MEYLVPVLLFLIVAAGGLAVLAIVGRLTVEPDDETPLGDTDEHSDTLDEPRRAA